MVKIKEELNKITHIDDIMNNSKALNKFKDNFAKMI
jgi:hypothetical protein